MVTAVRCARRGRGSTPDAPGSRGARLRRSGVALALACSLPLAAPLPAQEAAGDVEPAKRLEASLFRTWDEGGVTVVDGLASVPLAMLAASTEKGYRFEVAVRDGSGNVLHQDAWDRTVSRQAAGLAARGAELRESFHFGLMPGEYVVSLRAFPTDAPDLGVGAEAALTVPAERPLVSDLLLATEIRPLAEEAEAAAWPLAHSGLGISASAETVITTDRPTLYYYLELYVPEGEDWSGRVWAEIRRPDGATIYRTPEQEVSVVAPGAPLPGQLSVAGLPAGEYDLAMHAQGDGESEIRAASFRVAEPAPRAAAAGAEQGGYFWQLSDDELESTFGGVGLLLTDTERRSYEALPPDAKRRFLAHFFGPRDPNPATAENEFLQEYLSRVQRIYARYGETTGTEERPPWLTPRGRIYLMQGEPTDRIEERFPQAGGDLTRLGVPQPPYEIWYYGKTTGYVYLFADESGHGNYRMLYSTDPNIQSLPDWQSRAGEKAILDLQQHFGIKARFQTGSVN